jgi:hypothetical protein
MTSKYVIRSCCGGVPDDEGPANGTRREVVEDLSTPLGRRTQLGPGWKLVGRRSGCVQPTELLPVLQHEHRAVSTGHTMLTH